MRRIAIVLALALPLGGIARAGDKEEAVSQCKAAAAIQLSRQNIPPEQKGQAEELSAQLCDCVVTKVVAMGEDGEKILRVIAKMPPEKAAANEGAEADKANVVEVLVAEYGMSTDEAGAFYDRFNPKMEAISQECVASVMPK